MWRLAGKNIWNSLLEEIQHRIILCIIPVSSKTWQKCLKLRRQTLQGFTRPAARPATTDNDFMLPPAQGSSNFPLKQNFRIPILKVKQENPSEFHTEVLKNGFPPDKTMRPLGLLGFSVYPHPSGNGWVEGSTCFQIRKHSGTWIFMAA